MLIGHHHLLWFVRFVSYAMKRRVHLFIRKIYKMHVKYSKYSKYSSILFKFGVLVLLVVAILVPIWCYRWWSSAWRASDIPCVHSCGSRSNKLLTVKLCVGDGSDIKFPGVLPISGQMKIHQVIKGNWSIQVTIRKRVVVGYVTVKSFHLKDVCGLLRMAGRMFPKYIDTKKYSCPLQPGNIYLDKRSIPLPKVSGYAKYFGSGMYRMILQLTDASSGEEVECYRTDLKIKVEGSMMDWL